MKHIRSVSLALAGVALLAACSKPVATFQKSSRERFYSQQKAAEPAVRNQEIARVTANVPVVEEVKIVSTALTVDQTKQASDMLVSLKAANTTNRRMTKRIERVEKIVTEAAQKALFQTVATPKKAGLMERLMLKNIDKKIKKHMAPNESNALTGYVRLGAIVALAGLLLIVIGNSLFATIGLIALIGGLVLVLLGVLNQS